MCFKSEVKALNLKQMQPKVTWNGKPRKILEYFFFCFANSLEYLAQTIFNLFSYIYIYIYVENNIRDINIH